MLDGETAEGAPGGEDSDERDSKRVDEEWKRAAREEAEKLDRQSRGADGRETSLPEASFAALLSGFATQALMGLGAIKNPFSEERSVDLSAARYTIDLLGIVEEKTKGNLSEEEEKYLSSMLYDLRMRFVEARKAAGAAEEPPGAAEPQ